MRAMQHAGESSVEEILESIKKVIARDNRESAQAERKLRETGGIFLRNSADGPPVENVSDREDLPDDDPSDGTEDYAGDVADNADNDVSDDASRDSDEILDLGASDSQMIEEDLSPEVEFAPSVAEISATTLDSEPASENPEPSEDDDSSLTSDDTADSMRKSFAALSLLTTTPDESGESQSPLESMVRETLRPMLAEWLDDNLPSIVEQLVRDEIDRIAGKKR